MKVYREGKEIFEIKDYKQVGSFMNVATIEATVKTPTPFVFKVGDYVIFDYNGLTYTLYNVVPEKKQARSGTYGEAFIYELKFKADTEQLAICPFLDLVANDNGLHYTSLPSFSTYENIYGIAARLQANMDYLYPNKWRFNVVDATDEALMELLNEPREFSISGESCFDGLKKIYDIWGVSFIHTFENGVNVITIGKSAGTTSVFRYGKGQGLRTIKKNIQNVDQLCTRAYVYGSTRNIPALWYNDKGYIGEAQYAPNLMIPPSKWIGGVPQGAYIDAIFGDDNRIEKYGLRIKTLNYDGSDNNKEEIFPSIERVTAYDIRQAKEELGQTTYIPNTNLYADDDRMDFVLEGSNIEDDGVGTDANYILYSDKIYSQVKGETLDLKVAELLPDNSYKTINLQKSITLCSFDVTKPAVYRLSEVLDIATFYKTEHECTVSATIVVQKPSGEYIKLSQLSLSEKNIGYIQLPEVGNIKANEAGRYSIILNINTVWSLDIVLPSTSDGISLTCTIKEASVSLARGHNILSDFFNIKIKQIGFNINDVTASGIYKSIHIKNGMCGGRSFNITQCKYSEADDSWVLTCKRIDDNSISQRFPNKIFQIANGDQFVLLNIHMPDIYIHTAMQRLYNTAIDDLRHLSKPQYVIEPEIDNIQMARSPQIIKEGMYMPIEDTDISYIDDTLIDSVTITNKGNELRTFQVTLRSDKIINTFTKLASRISSLESSLADAESKSNISQAQSDDDSMVNTGGSANVDLSAYATIDYVDAAIQNAKDTRVDALINTTIPALESDIAERVLQTSFDTHISTYNTFIASDYTPFKTETQKLLDVFGIDEDGNVYVKKDGDKPRSFYAYGDIFAGGLGEEGASGGIIQQVYGVSAFGGTFDSSNLTDTFNAHAINSLYTTIQRGVKNPYALTINGTSYDGSSAVDITISGGGGGTFNGGTITGKTTISTSGWGNQLVINRSEGNGAPSVAFSNVGNGILGYIGIGGTASSMGTKPFYEDASGNSYILIHSGNIGSYALPTNGSDLTLTSSSNIVLNLNSTEDKSYIGIRFFKNGTRLGSIYSTTANEPMWNNVVGGHIMLHAGNYSNYTLPLSGGRITSTSDVPLILNRTQDGTNALAFQTNGTSKTYVGYTATHNLGSVLYNYASYAFIGIKDDGTPHYSNVSGTSRTLLHTGNYSSYALPLSGGTMTGSVTFPTNTYNYIGELALIVMPSAPTTLQLRTTNSSAMSAISFHASTKWYGTLSADTDSNLRWNDNIVIHSGNIGSYAPIYNSNGNVLIGTTTDNGHRLAVHRIISSITATTLNNSGMFIGAVGSYGTNFWVTGDGGGHIQQGRTDKSGTLYHLYLQELGGNVHIGVNTNYGYKLYVNGTGYFTGSVIAQGDITAGSDIRYKRKIQDVEIDLATIANAPLFNYQWTDREDKEIHLGSSAQYWMDTNFRDAVNTNNPDFFHLNYGALGVAIGVSVAKKVVNHEERIAALEKENMQLKQQLNEYRRLS